MFRPREWGKRPCGLDLAGWGAGTDNGGMDVAIVDLGLTVNGEVRRFSAPLTVAALVAALALDTRKVAVELNREIVPRSTYGRVVLADGDVLEIVHFIGGG